MAPLERPKILIVDDSPDNLQVLLEILKEDYAIIAATTGEKALALAAKKPIPDLMILDVVMPHLDGYEVCARLKANPQTQSIPVIFVTALSEVGNETKGFELGAIDYITKPLNPAVVKARIKSHLALQQLNQELQHKNQALAEATRLKDEFLANMSHELRTPLNAILGFSEALQEEILGPLNERQQKAIGTIESSGQHLLELINDILDLSKISAGKMELHMAPATVQSLCDGSLPFVKKQAFDKQISLASHIPAGLSEIVVDERRIRQALINLLSNAVKFTPAGGQVSLKVAVGCGNTWQGDTTIPEQFKSRNQPLILFQVTDNGIGIAPSNFSQLFQPFTQIDGSLNRSQSGTGLGLAMVKQIIELHGGEVAVESCLGLGSSFTVALPYAALANYSLFLEPASLPAKADYLEKAAIAPLILLAENNPANISTFTTYLTARGYQLIVAQNGEEVISLAKTKRPDLILMDTQMPGIDGLEATRQIRADAQLATVPIIALTPMAMEGDQELCLEAGVSQYFRKPVRLSQLVEEIQQYLQS